MTAGNDRVAGGSGIAARDWSVSDWWRNQAAWDALLVRSEADSLFLSWGWLTHWWQCYGDAMGYSPRIAAFYRGNDLVGLAPFYYRLVRRGAVVLTGSVQIIGLSWRDPEPLISEYLDVIAAPDDAIAVRAACVSRLAEDPSWQELVIGLTAAGEQWRDAIAACVPRG
ncbi:MAG: hypothetical protein ACRD3E_08350, partial [Terriglobales bacterium]